MSNGQLPSLSLLARELLAEERLRPPEDEALKGRVLARARGAVALGKPSGAPRVEAPALAAHRRWPRAAMLTGAGLAVAGLAAAGVGLYRLQTPPAQESSPDASQALPVASLPIAAAPGAEPAAPGAESAAPGAEESGSSAAPAPPVGAVPQVPAQRLSPADSPSATNLQRYELELSLLEPARRSIAARNYPAALASLARHQREFPRGQLSEEREALRVRAFWGMGQKESAARAADEFRRRYPKSALLSWMPAQAKKAR